MKLYKNIKILLFIFLLPINLIHHLLGFRIVKMNYRRIGHLISEYDAILNIYGVDQKLIYFCINKSLCANRGVLDIISKSHTVFTNRILVLLLESMTRWGRLSVLNTDKYIQANFEAAEYPRVLNNVLARDFKKKLVKDLEGCRSALLINFFGMIPSWYVCIHIRSNDEEYADGEIQKYRNTKLVNMRKSIDFIRKKGGSVILMGGKNRSERVPFDEYFDYTNSKYKSEFNDIALISGCKFFLGNTSGLFQVATFFDISCGISNVVPLSVAPFSEKDIYIYKHHYDNVNKKFLDFSEVKMLGFETERSKWHLQSRISLIENSDEEIESLCIAMYNQVIFGKEIEPTVYGYAKLDQTYYGYHSFAKLDPSFKL